MLLRLTFSVILVIFRSLFQCFYTVLFYILLPCPHQIITIIIMEYSTVINMLVVYIGLQYIMMELKVFSHRLTLVIDAMSSLVLAYTAVITVVAQPDFCFGWGTTPCPPPFPISPFCSLPHRFTSLPSLPSHYPSPSHQKMIKSQLRVRHDSVSLDQEGTLLCNILKDRGQRPMYTCGKLYIFISSYHHVIIYHLHHHLHHHHHQHAAAAAFCRHLSSDNSSRADAIQSVAYQQGGTVHGRGSTCYARPLSVLTNFKAILIQYALIKMFVSGAF